EEVTGNRNGGCCAVLVHTKQNDDVGTRRFLLSWRHVLGLPGRAFDAPIRADDEVDRLGVARPAGRFDREEVDSRPRGEHQRPAREREGEQRREEASLPARAGPPRRAEGERRGRVPTALPRSVRPRADHPPSANRPRRMSTRATPALASRPATPSPAREELPSAPVSASTSRFAAAPPAAA